GKVLAEHPDQRRELAEDPSLIKGAIEELLRFEPPAPHVGRYVARDVELHVDGGERLHVQLNVARETRMTDYLDANPGFIPLWSVRVVRSGTTVERAALNHRAIEMIREMDATDPRERP
ncbi:MAG: hypothetical protein RQ751_09915, partial [Longimicrobiales bacterium]|nr:hypothetical protein [Longimicrobiales bacterium]